MLSSTKYAHPAAANELDSDRYVALDHHYPAVRRLLAPDYQSMPAAEIEDLFYGMFGDRLSPEDVEFSLQNLGRDLASVGRQVAPIAAAAAPVVGTLAGTAIGGPVGAALGGAVGSAAGQALGQVSQPQPAPRPNQPQPSAQGSAREPAREPARRPGQRGRRPATSQPSALAAPAATQLAALLAHPSVQQSLLALLMGSAGRQSVQLAGASVPVGAIANAVEVFAREAAAEYTTLHAAHPEAVPSSYLMDESGTFLVDPASQDERALRVYELVSQDYANHTQGGMNTESNSGVHHRYLREQLEQFYYDREDYEDTEDDQFYLIDEDDVEVWSL